MKKKFLKLFTSVAMLALVFCLHQNVRAEEIAQPTEKDVYIHHDDGEDYVANRYERAIVVDRVVYQYLPEKDSYRIVAFDDNDEEFPEMALLLSLVRKLNGANRSQEFTLTEKRTDRAILLGSI